MPPILSVFSLFALFLFAFWGGFNTAALGLFWAEHRRKQVVLVYAITFFIGISVGIPAWMVLPAALAAILGLLAYRATVRYWMASGPWLVVGSAALALSQLPIIFLVPLGGEVLPFGYPLLITYLCGLGIQTQRLFSYASVSFPKTVSPFIPTIVASLFALLFTATWLGVTGFVLTR